MKFTLFLIVIFFKSQLAIAATSGNRISLKQFIEILEKYDSELKLILADKEKLGYFKSLNTSSETWLLEISNLYGYALDENENTSTVEGSLSKSFHGTGTSVSLSHQENKRIDRTETSSDIVVEQNLYKNAFGSTERKRQNQADLRIESLKLQILENYEAYLLRMSKLFLDYSQAYINVQLAKDMYEKAKLLEGNVRAKRSKSIASQADVYRSELQTLLRQDDLKQKEEELNILTEQIAAILPENSEKSLIPEAIFDFTRVYASQLKNKSPKLEQLRPIQILKNEENALMAEVSIEKDDVSPELDLLLGYSRDNATRFGVKVDSRQSMVGVKLNVPIGDSQSKAQVREARTEATKVKTETQVKLSNLKREEVKHLVAIDSLKSRVALHRKKISLTEKILKDEERRYGFGTYPLEGVIDTRNDLSQFQFQLQSDLVKLNKAVLDWLALTDQLLVKKIF